MANSNVIEQYQVAASSPHGAAHSLPFGVYTSQSIAELERERVFNSSWVFVCAEAKLSNAGDYYAFNLFGESLVVLRGKDQTLRVMSNVCRHRGTPL